MNVDISTWTVGQKMELGLQTTGLGLLVVFVSLALMIAIIMVLSRVLRDKKKEVKAPQVASAAHTPIVTDISPPVADDGEEAAVIAAAAAYYLKMKAGGATGPVNVTGLAVRPYRSAKGIPAWGKAGRNAQIYNKF